MATSMIVKPAARTRPTRGYRDGGESGAGPAGGNCPARTSRETSAVAGIHVTMSSNSCPATVEKPRATKTRSALPPLGFGFCASCSLVPPVAPLGPTDQTTTAALDASVSAAPQSLAVVPLPLWQM